MIEKPLQVFICRDPEAAWIEEQWREAQRQQAEWQLEEDLETEHQLARDYVCGCSECPWPWYADEPCEMQEPEVFGP